MDNSQFDLNKVHTSLGVHSSQITYTFHWYDILYT